MNREVNKGTTGVCFMDKDDFVDSFRKNLYSYKS